jgi:hypothetical protein
VKRVYEAVVALQDKDAANEKALEPPKPATPVR